MASSARTLISKWLPLAAVLGMIGVGLAAWRVYSRLTAPLANTRVVQRVVASEELILELTPRLKHLARSVMNLSLPDRQGRELFAPRVQVAQLDASKTPAVAERVPRLGVRLRHWPVEDSASELSAVQLELWRPLLQQVDYFEHAKFYFIRGAFTNDRYDDFTSQVGFQGLARLADGTWSAVKAKQQVRWRKQPTARDSARGLPSPSGGPQPASQKAAADWRITHWQLEELHTTDAERLLFTEVLDRAMPFEADLARARISEHYKILLQNYFPGIPARLPPGYSDSRYFPDSSNEPPGLSVVDIDADGHDDLYVTVCWGKNLLLRNRGDGTFEEVAAQYGLDIEGRSTCAIFADFDNDGDPDAILGRSLERSLYLVNNGGKFSDRSAELAGTALPYLVTSLSAADFNSDGLMDVYFTTYSPIDIQQRITSDQPAAPQWATQYLSPTEVQEVQRRMVGEHQYLGQVGPPNVLLVNRGGRFEVARESTQVAAWRNSLQGTWADYDEDGDPDLYVANDFATDVFYRNDGDAGFVDISQQSGIDLPGFGMGAAFGDYDNDGRQDLYASKMYSKAGKRITSQIPGIDARVSGSAEGNYLFHNAGQHRFENVAGHDPPALLVANAGWSWGGQFADFDNDGFLDLYVSSGFYTAPDEFAVDMDL
jgi:hypothetical protein